MSNRHVTAVALFAALVLFAAPGAQAAYVEYASDPATYGPLAPEWDPYDAGPPATGAFFSFPQWDPTANPDWHLTGIEVLLWGELTGQHGFDLISGTPDSVSMSTKATITAWLPDTSLSIIAVIPEQGDVWTTFPPERPVEVRRDLYDTATNAGYVDELEWGPFIGAGSVHVPLTAVALTDGSFSGSGFELFFRDSPLAAAQGHIRYHHTDIIPEPGTVALMALGLVGIAGFLSRRRKRQGHQQDTPEA